MRSRCEGGRTALILLMPLSWWGHTCLSLRLKQRFPHLPRCPPFIPSLPCPFFHGPASSDGEPQNLWDVLCTLSPAGQIDTFWFTSLSRAHLLHSLCLLALSFVRFFVIPFSCLWFLFLSITSSSVFKVCSSASLFLCLPLHSRICTPE